MSSDPGLIGKQIGHYRVLRQLGAGGMGEVFLAEDTHLDRQVALKVLREGTASDPERLARFQQEAKALASVNHPGIVTVYSVEHADGLDFITMELVEGRTLSGELSRSWLDNQHFFDIALPLTDAVSVAHEKGITHRDLKPANIMVTNKGVIKILDFGLAKLLEAEDGSAGASMLTKEFQLIGTPGYMSPEQIRGDSVDHRADIFSLGVILYEMATGQRPWEGKSSMDVASAVLRDTPAPPTALAPDLPKQLGRIIGQCLEKDPEYRCQSARDAHNQLRDLRDELREEKILETAMNVTQVETGERPSKAPRLAILLGVLALLVAAAALYKAVIAPGAGPQAPIEAPAGKPRIVVLPFENLGSPDDAFFADGMTEEITSRLAGIRSLSVISRTTAARMLEAGKSIPELGEELDVGYVLEGSVRWSKSDGEPSRVRVTPQLIRVSDDSHLWATTYDEVLDDVFDVQSAIAEAVIASLGVNLPGPDRESLEARPTDSLPAYQAYLRAQDWTRQPLGEETQSMAVQMFERAVELDPEFGRAWAGLAQHQALMYFNNWDLAPDSLDRASAALENAERILADDPRARLAAGYYRYYGLSDYAGALEEFEQAAAGLPNDTDVLLAIGLVQRRLGRLDEALERLGQARELDPQNIDLLDLSGETAQAMRRYEQADGYWREAISSAPDRTVLYERRAENELRWRGRTDAALAILAEAPASEGTLFSWDRIDFLDLDLVQRDYESLISRLRTNRQDDEVKEAKRQLVLGVAARLAGRPEASSFLAASRALYERLLDGAPENYRIQSGLGLAMAFQGEGDGSIELGRQAAAGDAADLYTGPMRQENLATIYAWTGETDLAIELLRELLGKTYQQSVSPALLGIDPVWDPLRQDPRFEELVASP